MAHGAMPDKGANPLTALARATAALTDLQQRLQTELGPYEHLGEIWITPTYVAGGSIEQLNVIPADAAMAVDIRTTPAVDHPRLLAEIGDLLAESTAGTGVLLELTVIDDRPSTDTPTDSPVVRALALAHEHVTGQPAVYGGVPGTTDGTILWRDGGLDSVVYGPGGKWIAHQIDEFVEVSEIIQATGVFAHAAHAFLTDG
ncbi:MAG: M20/M25/M40 family metallo-hydrolase, partial [Acidimicrobiales bacterium]